MSDIGISIPIFFEINGIRADRVGSRPTMGPHSSDNNVPVWNFCTTLLVTPPTFQTHFKFNVCQHPITAVLRRA